MNKNTTIPIYPKIEDMIIIIDSLVDTLDKGSIGILYNFGKNIGIKYYEKMVILDIFNVDDKFSSILNTMVCSNWFSKVTVRRISDVELKVCTTGTGSVHKRIFMQLFERICDRIGKRGIWY